MKNLWKVLIFKICIQYSLLFTLYIKNEGLQRQIGEKEVKLALFKYIFAS